MLNNYYIFLKEGNNKSRQVQRHMTHPWLNKNPQEFGTCHICICTTYEAYIYVSVHQTRTLFSQDVTVDGAQDPVAEIYRFDFSSS